MKNVRKDTIEHLSAEIYNHVVSLRRQLHRNPELSFKEYNTSALIKQQLSQWGISFSPCAATGVVALITGMRQGNTACIALRADMDALPITQDNTHDYVSCVPGVMHACGHDVHTASLLGTAYILQHMRHTFAGTIKLIFQPGEEELPGGASLMIKEGVLENPAPKAIIGQHIMPFIPTGKAGFRSGMYMASTDELYITIHGRGGHGAQPHQNVDPVIITAHLITMLQAVASRFADPRIPTVLSIGRVIADGRTNVIPSLVKLEGTLRTFNEEWRAQAHEHIRNVCHSVAQGFGGTAEVDIRGGYPYLVNDDEVTARARATAKDYLGDENVTELDLWMAAEDFASYSQHIPACFYRIGTGNADKDTEHPVHTARFNIDEDALKISTGLMAYIALNALDNA